MEPLDLNDVARRPARYWNLDGLPELMLGLLWMVWGSAWLFGQTLPHDWRWNVYWLLVPALLAALGLAMNRLVRALKERITFPRAGYVAWKEPDRRTSMAFGAAIVGVAMILALVVLDTPPAEMRAPAVLSVILSLAVLALGVRQRTPRHIALGGVLLVLALAIGTLTSGWAGFNWMLLAAGTVCTIMGAVRLTLFLRAHPRPAEQM
jgi:MFS family permease